MKLHIGPVPLNERFRPEQDGWRPLREPTPVLMQFLAAPIGLVTGVALAAASGLLGFFNSPLDEPAWLLVVVVGTIPVHEVVHMLVHPRQGRSADSILGVWPSMLLFYAHYDHVLTRNRLLLILAMPFLVLSVAPLPLCWLLGFDALWVAVLAIWNGVCSCGDLLGVLIIGWQLPRTAVVRNQGYYTWWKVPSAEGVVVRERC